MELGISGSGDLGFSHTNTISWRCEILCSASASNCQSASLKWHCLPPWTDSCDNLNPQTGVPRLKHTAKAATAKNGKMRQVSSARKTGRKPKSRRVWMEIYRKVVAGTCISEYLIDVESTHLLAPHPPRHTRKLLEQNPAFVMIEVCAEKTDGPLMGNRQVHEIQTPAAWRYSRDTFFSTRH